MSEQPELFEVETKLSPEMEWRNKHDIKTYYDPDHGYSQHIFDDAEGDWIAGQTSGPPSDIECNCGFGRIGYGETEEDAIADLMKKAGIPPMKRTW